MQYLNKNPLRLNIYISSICILLYLLNEYCLKLFFPTNIFITGYFNDLLAMPLLFSLVFIASVKYRVKWVPFHSVYYYILTLLFSCFLFEYVRSLYVFNSTTDFVDIICYTLGTLLYLLMLSLIKYNK